MIEAKHLSICTAILIGLAAGQQRAAGEVAPVSFDVGAFTFERPAEWEWVPTASAMRKAELRIPNPDGDPGEMTFFHFGAGQGGGVDANIARWLGQFVESPPELESNVEQGHMGNVRVSFVKAAGTFQSGMPGGPVEPRPGYALHGAILEHPSGDVFVKLTGPRALVEVAAIRFDAFIKAAAAAGQSAERAEEPAE